MSPPAVPEIETRLFLNNEFVPSSSGKTFPIKNPLTEEHVCDVYEADHSDVDTAVKYAKAALPGWRDTPLSQRTAALRKLVDVIETHHDEISYLEWVSFGKSRGYFKHEAQFFLEIIRYYAGIVYDLLGAASLNTPNQLNVTFREPFGVTAAICAWNAPIASVATKVAPALLTGNVIIVKPSEKAPLTLTYIGTLIKKYNIFPPGVYQVVNGFGPAVGAPLASHMEIRKLSFTGSGPTGRILKKLAADSNLKNVTLELGGKSPQIVLEDADVEEAAKHAAQSITYNAGQICIAPSRAYVHKSIAPKYVNILKAAMAAMGEGHALPTEHLGHYQPQADEAQFKRVLSMIESGKTSGAELILGGERATEKGFWIKPTVFYEVPEDAKIQKNEVFGPVINVNTFEDEEEVIKKANDSEYGLWANIYSKDIARALRIAKKIEAGSININQTGPSGYAIDLPFGGYKQSGEGKELGRQGLEEWVETKTVLINLGNGKP